jgi:tetratricopeptide (TPR) repeat protein
MKILRPLLLLTVALAAGLVLSAAPAHGAVPDPDLDAANQAYQSGRYDEAARLFHQLIDERGYSAPLCFDLGNAEFRAGHDGPALLAYERARYLAPADPAIDHNLQLARAQAGLAPDPYRWWQVVMRSIDWSVWLAVILVCLVLLLLALIVHRVAEALAASTGLPAATLRRGCKGIFFVCLPLALFFGFVELSAVGFGDRIEAVVVTKQAALRLSPFDGAEQTGTLPEGELVTVEEGHDGWFWIDERSRQSGWVSGHDLEPVVPGSLGNPP